MARKLSRVMRPSVSPALTSRSTRRLAPPRFMSNRHLASLFRQATEEEPCEKCKDKVHRQAAAPAEANTAPAIVHEVLSSPGQPLERGVRAEMEHRFGGADFSDVRVHMDAKAAESAEAVNARAYTVGQEIVFNSQCSPSSEVNRHTLAHELSHTIQQDSASHLSRQQNNNLLLNQKYECPEADYHRFKNAVDSACKGSERSCLGVNDINEIQRRIELTANCIAARYRLMFACFRGGDDRHLDHLQQDINALKNCHEQREKLEHQQNPLANPSSRAKRIGLSALIGASFGAILGAMAGFVGGTLVAPGVGTISGTSIGVTQGAAFGSVVGAGAFVAADALIEWLVN